MSFPNRIVCLAAETPEILHRLGVLDKVAGISAYTTRPEEALRIPKVSGFKFGSVERIMRLNPDLVILTSGVQKELAMSLAAAGVTLLHFNPHRLTDLFDEIRLLGNVVGKPEEAERLNDEIQSKLYLIEEQRNALSVHPRVYFEEWMDPFMCGTGWVSDLITIAGGRDVFRERSLTGRSAIDRVVTDDDIIEAQPDIVLASWCGKPFDKASFVSRTGFSEIPAVIHDEVHEVRSEILQFGPMLLDSLKELHACFARFATKH
ncbi:MAG: ABC transporter substrate-binding protein [Alicyclobacillus sp.]|nr:ABC transporter substrate-binding protein [Alicyclobacillus sp.]